MIIGFIGFVLCLIQLIIFDWFTKKFTYTYKLFKYRSIKN